MGITVVLMCGSALLPMRIRLLSEKTMRLSKFTLLCVFLAVPVGGLAETGTKTPAMSLS